MNDQTLDPAIHIHELGSNARAAGKGLLTASTEAKNTALTAAAKALRDHQDELLEANAKDVESVAGKKPESFVDRLKLTPDRIEGMASALEQIAELPDPVGRKLAEIDRPNGLKIERVAVPIGVIGMIYESRPNVGADASALCLKSGNAVILRGGSESRNSTRVIVRCMQEGLKAAGLPEHAVQTVGTTDRAAVAELLKADEFVDLVIPRGGRGLVELVRDQASVPTLLHLDGNCHTYVHSKADLDKAAEVIRNARRIVAARKSAGEFERAIRGAKLDELQPDIALDYGAFVNPFTDFLHALCLWSLAADGRENALVSLRRIHSTLGGPGFLADEIGMVDRILGGAKHPDLTYVIFETGVAPIRREVRLDVPLYDKNVPYVAAAFPRLERRGRSTHAHVAIGGTKREATLICDMDAVVARDFRTGLPAVIFRTLAASAAKAAVAKKAREEAGDLGAIAGFLYQAAGAQADLRTWITLPKEFRVCRVETPGDRKLALLVGPQKSEVTVNTGRVNVVCVKSFAPGAPLKIQQFQLK